MNKIQFTVLFLIVFSFNLSGCNCSESNFNSGKDDTLQVVVKINNSLPIGWGILYQCKVVKIMKGKLSDNETTFEMSASVGSESIFKDLQALDVNKTYFIEFVKSDRKSKTTYIPSGTTGLMDKDGIIWDMTKLKVSE